MADDESPAEEGTEEDAPKKGGKGMLIGLVGALVMGGGGFFAAYSGMLPIGGSDETAEAEEKAPPKAMAAQMAAEFVPLDKLVVSLGREARAKHLMFTAQLEVFSGHTEEVTNLMPRILDVLNTYLRAVDERELESPSAMLRLRAQMLRRVQIVTGEGKVKDLLVTEFVLN